MARENDVVENLGGLLNFSLGVLCLKSHAHAPRHAVHLGHVRALTHVFELALNGVDVSARSTTDDSPERSLDDVQ